MESERKDWRLEKSDKTICKQDSKNSRRKKVGDDSQEKVPHRPTRTVQQSGSNQLPGGNDGGESYAYTIHKVNLRERAQNDQSQYSTVNSARRTSDSLRHPPPIRHTADPLLQKSGRKGLEGPIPGKDQLRKASDEGKEIPKKARTNTKISRKTLSTLRNQRLASTGKMCSTPGNCFDQISNSKVKRELGD